MMTTGRDEHGNQQATIEKLLDDEQVLVHINPAISGVILPPHLGQNRTVTLRLSRYFRGDLFLDDEKIEAELLFGSEYFSCVLPWKSIWGASSIHGEEYVWAEAAPEEILDLILAQQQRHQPHPSRRAARDITARPRSQSPRGTSTHLRRVK